MSVRGHHRSFGVPDPEVLRSNVNHERWDNDHVFHDLPDATGPAPYHMDLSDILAPEETARIQQSGKLVLHATGDTGNVRNDFQVEVSQLMIADAGKTGAKLCYHLGDVVYDYGEDREYPGQFYEIYAGYHYPIVAIPGNHDGARFDGGPDSLVGFMTNFCDTRPRMPPSIQRIGRHPGRDTMTQPNCYWTLNTPFCTIIGLYTNVPSGGDVREPQVSWFLNEMRSAPASKQLIVAMHHPVHSVAKGAHAGSKAMESLLLHACQESGRVPKLVLCGHVHNYQRFTTTFLDKPCTFVVVGSGGHAKDRLPPHASPPVDIPHTYPVRLEFATDKEIGFLRIVATAETLECEFVAVGHTKSPDKRFTL